MENTGVFLYCLGVSHFVPIYPPVIFAFTEAGRAAPKCVASSQFASVLSFSKPLTKIHNAKKKPQTKKQQPLLLNIKS